jgi:hypothetical protein
MTSFSSSIGAFTVSWIKDSKGWGLKKGLLQSQQFPSFLGRFRSLFAKEMCENH